MTKKSTTRRHNRHKLAMAIVTTMYVQETGNQLRPRSKNDYALFDEWLEKRLASVVIESDGLGSVTV